jgi:hypothetical protein
MCTPGRWMGALHLVLHCHLPFILNVQVEIPAKYLPHRLLNRTLPMGCLRRLQKLLLVHTNGSHRTSHHYQFHHSLLLRLLPCRTNGYHSLHVVLRHTVPFASLSSYPAINNSLGISFPITTSHSGSALTTFTTFVIIHLLPKYLLPGRTTTTHPLNCSKISLRTRIVPSRKFQPHQALHCLW